MPLTRKILVTGVLPLLFQLRIPTECAETAREIEKEFERSVFVLKEVEL